MYPTGSVHVEELENMYILSLSGSFSSRLLDLRTIGGTLSQIVPGGVRTTDSEGGLSVGLYLLQQYVVKLDNDQIIASELNYNLLVLILALSKYRHESFYSILYLELEPKDKDEVNRREVCEWEDSLIE